MQKGAGESRDSVRLWGGLGQGARRGKRGSQKALYGLGEGMKNISKSPRPTRGLPRAAVTSSITMEVPRRSAGTW
jgi:hypothetical protein